MKVIQLSKKILPLAIGGFFIFLSYQNTSADDRENVIKYIQNADYRFVSLSALFGILSHISRAIRWKLLLAPMGYNPRLINSILAVLIGYLSNLGIPRSGELLRATVMDRYEKIPFQKGFGTVIAERVIDLILLLLFITFALILQYELVVDFLKIEPSRLIRLSLVFLIILIGFLIIRKILIRSSHPVVEKVRTFLTGIWDGINSIRKLKNKGAFILHTLFIWSMYILMFYVIKYAIPETSILGFDALIPAFVVGGLSMSASNGGMGIYPFAVSVVLIAFGISKESGLAFGWIMWSCQTLLVVTFGAISFFTLPLINRLS